MFLRQTQLENLRATSNYLIPALEQLEMQMQLLLEGNIMRQISLESIQKKLAKKNAELLEVQALRKKLALREKNISDDIESLQNQKVEIIFMQVKRQIKNEKLDVSSGSVLPLLEAIRNSQQSSDDTHSVEKIVTQADDSILDAHGKTEFDSVDKLDSISKTTETGRDINEH